MVGGNEINKYSKNSTIFDSYYNELLIEKENLLEIEKSKISN